MKRSLFCLIWFILCTVGVVQAELYRGTIGKSAVMVQLTPHEDAGNEEYFYDKHRAPIGLSRVKDCTREKLCYEELPSARTDEGPNAQWVLKPTSDGYVGTWSKNNKTLDVRLQTFAFAVHDPLNRAYAKQYPLRAALTDNIRFEKGKTETFMGKRLQWYVDPKSGLSHFLIISGYPAEVLTDVNDGLRYDALDQAYSRANCIAYLNGDGDVQTEVVPRYMDDYLISITTRTDSYCNGFSSDSYIFAQNYAVKLKRNLSLEDILWLGQGKAHVFMGESMGTEAADWQNYEDYRTKTVNPWLVKNLTAHAPDAVKNAPAGDDYEHDYTFSDVMTWFGQRSDIVWWWTPQGLYVLPDALAHTQSAKALPDYLYLPYSLIRPHPGVADISLPDHP